MSKLTHNEEADALYLALAAARDEIEPSKKRLRQDIYYRYLASLKVQARMGAELERSLALGDL